MAGLVRSFEQKRRTEGWRNRAAPWGRFGAAQQCLLGGTLLISQKAYAPKVTKQQKNPHPDGRGFLLVIRQGGLGSFADEFNRVTEGLDGLGGVIGDLDAELFFEGHNQLNGVQAVCAQIVDEGSVFDNFVFFNAQVFYNDFFDAVCDIAHFLSSFVWALWPS
jgi:hypothetical protein